MNRIKANFLVVTLIIIMQNAAPDGNYLCVTSYIYIWTHSDLKVES